MDQPIQSHRLPRTHRLSGRLAFDAVFQDRGRAQAGPLHLRWTANNLEHLRMGLSVSRRVGTAVVRQRIKRLLREAYRLQRGQLPLGYDVVIVVRPHAPADLATYMRWLRQGLGAAARCQRPEET